MGVKTIGVGGDYSTIAAWENDIGVGDATGPWIGQLLAQTHDSANLTIAIGPATSETDYIRLTAAPGAAHQGMAADTGLSNVAHAIWNRASGIAVLSTLTIQEDFVEIDHIEMVSAVSLTTGDFISIANGGVGATNLIKLHHLLIHHNGASTNAGNDGIVALDADAIMEIYRNIFYGLGGRALNLATAAAAGSKIHHNTVYGCNLAAGSGVVQYTMPTGAYDAYNNMGFLPNKTDAEIFDNPPNLPTGSTKSGNASDYQPEPLEETFETYTNVGASTVLRNATQTWTQTDCRIKKDGVLRDLGTVLDNQFREGIAGNIVEDGKPDIGADEWPMRSYYRVTHGRQRNTRLGACRVTDRRRGHERAL